MLTIHEINLKIKKVNTMDYEDLKVFRNQLIEFNQYSLNLKKSTKDNLFKLLVSIFNKIKTFEQFESDPDFHKELKPEKLENEKNYKSSKTRNSHNYNIVFKTQAKSIKDLCNSPVIFTITNNENGKTYVTYASESSKGIKKILNTLDCSENCAKTSVNKELSEDFKKLGSKNFTLTIEKITNINLLEEEKINLMNELLNQGVQLYNKK